MPIGIAVVAGAEGRRQSIEGIVRSLESIIELALYRRDVAECRP
jgi:hypothetical protein